MAWHTDVIRRLGHKPWFAAIGRRLVPVDKWFQQKLPARLSGLGRRGLPTLLLTATGRRSGAERTQPLLYATDGDAYVVVGSNWGQAHHPAWTANLLAHPEAAVTVAGRRIPVTATLAEGAERDRLWALLSQLWPAYATYEKRAAGRHLRVFRLVPRNA